jgi:hypothetical protein
MIQVHITGPNVDWVSSSPGITLDITQWKLQLAMGPGTKHVRLSEGVAMLMTLCHEAAIINT